MKTVSKKRVSMGIAESTYHGYRKLSGNELYNFESRNPLVSEVTHDIWYDVLKNKIEAIDFETGKAEFFPGTDRLDEALPVIG